MKSYDGVWMGGGTDLFDSHKYVTGRTRRANEWGPPVDPPASDQMGSNHAFDLLTPPPHTTYTHTQRPFDGAAFAAAGTAYAMGATDAAAYARPYADAAASAAIAATMDPLDFPALLREVDDGFQRWRQPRVLPFGGPSHPSLTHI